MTQTLGIARSEKVKVTKIQKASKHLRFVWMEIISAQSPEMIIYLSLLLDKQRRNLKIPIATRTTLPSPPPLIL